MPENLRPKIFSRVDGLRTVKSMPQWSQKPRRSVKAVLKPWDSIPKISSCLPMAGILSAFMLSTLYAARRSGS